MGTAVSGDLHRFLRPSAGIQCDHPQVAALAEQITAGARDQVEAAGLLFDYARDTVRYSVHVPFTSIEDYLALNTLKRGAGFCAQKAALLCTLARCRGIPARLVFADIQNHLLSPHLAEIITDGVIHYHTFTELFINGRWLKATPAFDAELSRQEGWRLVEFSPEADALLPATDLSDRPHITYLRYHGWREGMALQEFLEVTAESYKVPDIQTWKTLASRGGAWPAEKEAS